MILGALCLSKHYTFTWYHWFWTIWSWEKVDFSVIRLREGRGPEEPACAGEHVQIHPLSATTHQPDLKLRARQSAETMYLVSPRG